jgi:hypothetical protein
MPLNTQPNLPRPDDFYEALIDTHRNMAVLREALAAARLALPATTA